MTEQVSAFPVTWSTLSAGSVSAEVAQVYPIGPPESCQLLKPGSNDTYLLSTKTQRYIVRVYRVRWRTLAAVAYELELLHYLAARGVAVSVPIPSEDARPVH